MFLFFIIGVIAGLINAVAGGGSLLSFPALIADGVSPIMANATNTAAIWLGSIGSVFGYVRKVDAASFKPFKFLFIPSLLGGIAGAVILVKTPEGLFNLLAPFLVFFATLLFAFRKQIKSFAAKVKESRPQTSGRKVSYFTKIFALFIQFIVAIYGGYFGAGIGLLTLGILAILHTDDLRIANTTKVLLSVLINGVALIFFAKSSLIAWKIALVMGLGTMVGGYTGARVANKLPEHLLHRVIVILGLIISTWLMIKALHVHFSIETSRNIAALYHKIIS